MQQRSFKRAVALVTGGASGIGKALCERLAREGASVAVADVDIAGASSVAAAICAGGGEAWPIELDVTDHEAVRRAVETTAATRGIDYLFNNAGVGISGEASEIGIDCWRRVMEVNFFGVLHGTLAACDAMARRGGGHIVNVSSLAGFAPFACNAPYTAAKYAVTGFTEAIRAEVEGKGIRITLVCPGIVRTPFYESMQVVGTDPEAYRARLPQRLMTPDRAAEIILRGVARGRRRIVFPLHAKIIWWAGKFAPVAIEAVNRFLVREFRRCGR